MNNTTFIVQIFFDYDRPPGPDQIPLTKEWINDRFKKFMSLTYQSLRNQSFKDFKIFIICGNRKKYNKHIPISFTKNLPWPKDVVLCFARGILQYKYKIHTPYVAILRIDSDDLLHRHGMRDIKENIIFNSSKRTCLIFRKNLEWNTLDNYIKPHWRQSPPFFVHVFPKKVYKDWNKFCKQHYITHGKAGGRRADTKELPMNRVCVVKHSQNFSALRRGLTYEPMTENQKMVEVANHEGDFIIDPVKIKKVLKGFNINLKEFRKINDT